MSKQHANLGPLDPNRRYSVAAALVYLGIGRRNFYADIKAGRIVTIKERRRRFVPGAEIARLSRPPGVADASAA